MKMAKNKNGFNGHYHEKEYIEKQRKSHLGKFLGKNHPNYKTGEFCGDYKKKGWNPNSIGRPFKKGQIMNPHILNQEKENNPNWNGGTSFEPYTFDFNIRFKEAIRERDNRCCIICNRMEEELNELLSIHHIDYDKKNTFPQNCVSLCRKHHADTQINRQHWKTFFQSLLKERYNYEYTEDQKIILDFNKLEEVK